MKMLLDNKSKTDICTNNTLATNPIASVAPKELLSKDKIKEIVARRAAKEFRDGDVVTLGIGLPTAVADYVPEGINVTFQSENGLLGLGKSATGDSIDKAVINAGGGYVEANPGASFYDGTMAFTMMRGGHVDATILGALQVDAEGNIASWAIPGKFVPGIGGSMDLIVGAKKVIVAMEHTSKGQIKILQKCNLPLTASHQVNLIITERCVFEVTEKGLVMIEINPMFSIADIKESTGASFIISDNLKHMTV